ncbi:MAG: ThuA domain-containing protein [Candidatus Latescibacteria bacterium]|nr:ThuA domain-containing protein [Candidatus Latescibacterota bacterium]
MTKIKTLVFTGGQIHDFKGNGQAILEALAEGEEFAITAVEEDLDTFVAPHLDPYDLMVFYYTVGTLADAQKNGLLNWVASGKGFVGVHSAADSFRECPEYRAMLGGSFVTHPRYRDYQVSVADPDHPITEGLTEFIVRDEQYILDYDPRVHVLCTALYRGNAVPVAWTKGWGKGRVFYLALGHDQAACRQEMFRVLLQSGALWAGRPSGE